jgi:hypothetical protein
MLLFEYFSLGGRGFSPGAKPLARVGFSPSSPTPSTTPNLSFRPEGRRFLPARSGDTVLHRTFFVR